SFTFEKEDLRDIILAASVRKKPFSNDAITPLHCAAINPNVKYITRLLSIEPDINIQTQSRARPIHFAAACEGSAPLEFLLKRNAGVNDADSKGDLPIHYAARSGRSKNIDVLMKHAKSNVSEDIQLDKWGLGMINKPNRFAFCPVHMAVEGGHLDALRTLIKHGVDVNKPLSASRDKITPLMIAAQRGDLNIARTLVQSGAAVELLDKKKRSALTHAIINGSTNVASYLLYLGADPNRADSSNNTLVHYAAAYGWYFCLKLLIKDAGAKPDEPNDWQTTPINIAFLKGNHGLVEMLFNHKGVDINFQTSTGMTLACIACSSRLVEGLDSHVSHLIRTYKADPTIRDHNGYNALHHLAANTVKTKGTYWDLEVDPAAMQISVRIAEILIEAGCDPTLRTNEGKTPVMLAIEQVNVELVRFLVEKGGTTVLHLMAEQCCTTDLTPMLKILAEHTPDVNSINGVDAKGDSPRKVGSPEKEAANLPPPPPQAAVSQQETLKKMAQDRDFVGFTPLLRACHTYKTFRVGVNISKQEDVKKAHYALEFIQALIELTGSDVDAVVGPKNMPDEPELHYAPEGKSSSLHFLVNAECENKSDIGAGLKLLLRHNPDPNLRDMNDKTPLVLAVESSREAIVKALLEGGADPNVLIKGNHFHITPLILAAERGDIEVMKLLIQHKADVKSSRSDNQRTAIHIMVTNRVREDDTIAMIQILLQAGADINAVDIDGNTPLHLAVQHNKGHSDSSTSLEEFLLDRGANVFAKNKHLDTPLHIALEKNGVDPIELCSLLTSVMRDQKVDEPNEKGFTPLLYAASSGATICCMHLLQVRVPHISCAIMLMQRNASLSHPIVISLPHKEEVKKETEEEKKKKKRPVLTWRPKRQWLSQQPKEIPGSSITIFEGAVKNDLTGVAHMLLDALGMPMEAVESALNLSKFYLALRLLRRIPDVSRLHAKNKEGQNLFHVLALRTSRHDPDLQIKVAGALLEKRIPIADKDKHRFTPLMYAALKHQSVVLAKFLIENDLKFDPKVRDVKNRDIMAAFMWDYNWVSDKFKVDEVRQWLDTLLDIGHVSLDTLYDHPLPDPLLLGATVACEQPDYFSSQCKDSTSPLIFAIRNYDLGLAKFMLQKGANPNFADSNGLTPMMHAVRMNDVKMVKLLLNYSYDAEADVPEGKAAVKPQLSKEQSRQVREYTSIQKTSPVDLSLADKNGWTAVHHAVCSLSYATFDNAEIVYILARAGAPLEAKNTFTVTDVVADKVKPDVRADAEEMLNKLDAGSSDGEQSDLPKVDDNCEIKKVGEVARSPTTNIPYDVTLSKVDVTCGQYGMYNFYKMQIVRHTAKNLYILFTRWGRIGDRGQYQHTPYQSLAEAAKEFCKIFRSKTGNDWSQIHKFQNHPKKYRLMPKPSKQHKQHKVEFNLESSLPTKLPEPVFDLVSEVSSVNMLLASTNKFGLDEDFMPFGRIKRETLLEARRLLTDISELIDKVTKLRNNLTVDVQAEFQSNCEEIVKLTNEYYHLVPISGYEAETIQPIADKKMLRDHTKLLADLMDLQIANTVLLGANLRKSEINPIDYIYNSLDCRVQPLGEEDPETQFILTNIHATVPTANINRIFRVAREGENARLAALNMPNHQLLWHGSSMSNFISILSRGLLVTPPEVPWTGHLFGEGIYFADTFVKSSHYCHNHSLKSNCKVMLLCEVALGNSKIDVKHGDEDHLDEDINSLKILGQNAPVPDFDARLPFGATLSLGQVQRMEYHPPARITHNEYIVHNADQVAIRYLVLFNG
ncbi:unnamed protein product, partial [Candidula unifasciata]